MTDYKVGAGQTSSGTTLKNGDTQKVFSGGQSFGTTVGAKAAEYVSSEGVATGTTVKANGALYVSSGGVARGTTVRAKGIEQISSGGVASGTALQAGGTIDVTNLAYVPGGSANLNSTNDVLTVAEGGKTYKQQLSGNYTNEYFHLSRDSSTGTSITVSGTPCYCRGTHVLTDRGEVGVEDLHIGDRLMTFSGAARPIRWIGRRSYAGRFAVGNRDVLPVLIRHGALAANTPRRDLLVSPLHAMYLDGVLIPASALVNGSSIVQVEAVEQVEYFYLELDTHDIILAEGAPSETFVDDDSRGMFHNEAEYRARYPEAVRVPARYCAPRVEEGEALEAVRRRLAAMAHPAREAEPPPGDLGGHLDHVGRDRITGWACDKAVPNQPVRLRILANKVVIGEAVADRYRADLQRAGMGTGRHGFSISIPGGLSPLVRHVVEVERALDGRKLPNSPCVVAATPIAVAAPSKSDAVCPGCLDLVSRDRIAGWAHDPSNSGAAVPLQVLDNGVPVARVLANFYRADLAEAGIGDGRHGFDIILPGGLAPFSRHVIQARRETDGAEICGSPVVIEAAGSFDATLEQAVARAVNALGPDDDQERVLSFILAQADRVLQHRADATSHRAERLAYQRLRRRHELLPEGVSNPGLRALVVDERVPVANRDAGSQAILSHMRALQGLGYAVSFVAAEEMAGREHEREVLEADGIGCYSTPFHVSVEDVLRRQACCFDLVYLHRVDIATRYLTLARRYLPQARILYSTADLHHVRLERQAVIEETPELLAASRRKRLEECVATWAADAVITHSAEEAAALRQAVPEASVHRVPWAVPVRQAVTPFAGRRGVAFVGSYAHTPNLDAARWLVEAVMPLVWQADPGIECLLVGSEMPQAVRNLAGPGVVPLGQVADLAAGVFDRVRLTVAPLRYGAGVKGKVLDSMAAGVPCVMSPVAAEGLPLPASLRALVGEEPAQIAALICRLHQDEAAHRNAVRAGLSLIRKCHTETVVTTALWAAIEGRAPTEQTTEVAPPSVRSRTQKALPSRQVA